MLLPLLGLRMEIVAQGREVKLLHFDASYSRALQYKDRQRDALARSCRFYSRAQRILLTRWSLLLRMWQVQLG